LIGHDFDYTPPNPYPTKRNEKLEAKAKAEWEKLKDANKTVDSTR
jgi:hypothetical protein